MGTCNLNSETINGRMAMIDVTVVTVHDLPVVWKGGLGYLLSITTEMLA